MSSLPDVFVHHLQDRFPDGRILILGFGREGRSTYRVLRGVWPEREIWVADEHEPDLSEFADSHLFFHPSPTSDLAEFQIIWKTPSFPPTAPALVTAVERGSLVTSQLNEFLAVYGARTIGVTGTKGKSTTSALIHHLLQTNGVETVLGGNIGTPVFDLASELEHAAWAVVEMSSYQLASVTHSPHVAVWLNLFPEHLNYHGTLEEYATAKANITKFQSDHDTLVVPHGDAVITPLVASSRAKRISFDPSEPSWQALSLKESDVANLPVVAREQLLLPAVLAARAVHPDLILNSSTLEHFHALPHRLELVETQRGIQFYDDTLATIPQATIAALTALPSIDVLILGGQDRGISFEPIVEALQKHPLPHVILMGESGAKMKTLLESRNTPSALHSMPTIEAAVQLSFELLRSGGVVVLSPASPSFDQFANYEAKALAYRHAISQGPAQP
jgi:UDP-N-acetylmuramoyl-L-alanine---L-glutamate ligase